ncbi:MAG TPA: FAD-dependent oxidoreductase [Bryobacteraceae bacterium]|nr:FAD-dependent oxidoreductase [Bryobacteraceae bacterium]
MNICDVAIIGAGPYGLSAAAHLSAIKNLDVRIFGEPMSFWSECMPTGMYLRSNYTATEIADPHHSLTLGAYQAATGCTVSTPVPLDRFIDYGLWYQRSAVPHVDRRLVSRVATDPRGFRLTVGDTGETIYSRRVVVAAGIGSFPRRPTLFQGMPGPLVSHTSEHREFRRFAGKTVLIVGGGQSALESAALLRECGAEAEVIARSGHIHWLQGALSKTLHHRLGKTTRRLLYAPTDVGPAGVSQLVARPDLLKYLPRGVRNTLWMRCIRPAGARWLVHRLQGVPVRLGRSVVSAAISGGRVSLRLDDDSPRVVDHVLLGTGYRVDISRYGFFSPELSGRIHRANGYPLLGEGLETSVPGLHILGAPAAWSYGPLMQFVSGARYASLALSRRISRGARR